MFAAGYLMGRHVFHCLPCDWETALYTDVQHAHEELGEHVLTEKHTQEVEACLMANVFDPKETQPTLDGDEAVQHHGAVTIRIENLGEPLRSKTISMVRSFLVGHNVEVSDGQ